MLLRSGGRGYSIYRVGWIGLWVLRELLSYSNKSSHHQSSWQRIARILGRRKSEKSPHPYSETRKGISAVAVSKRSFILSWRRLAASLLDSGTAPWYARLMETLEAHSLTCPGGAPYNRLRFLIHLSKSSAYYDPNACRWVGKWVLPIFFGFCSGLIAFQLRFCNC